MEQGKKSEAAMKFTEETFKQLDEFDIQQQNQIIIDLCRGVIQNRKGYLDKIAKDREQYAATSDQLIKQLSEVSMS